MNFNYEYFMLIWKIKFMHRNLYNRKIINLEKCISHNEEREFSYYNKIGLNSIVDDTNCI